MTATNDFTPLPREPLDAQAAFALGLWPALRNLATPQRPIRKQEPVNGR